VSSPYDYDDDRSNERGFSLSSAVFGEFKTIQIRKLFYKKNSMFVHIFLEEDSIRIERSDWDLWNFPLLRQLHMDEHRIAWRKPVNNLTSLVVA
jgi:hypothetical protein